MEYNKDVDIADINQTLPRKKITVVLSGPDVGKTFRTASLVKKQRIPGVYMVHKQEHHYISSLLGPQSNIIMEKIDAERKTTAAVLIIDMDDKSIDIAKNLVRMIGINEVVQKAYIVATFAEYEEAKIEDLLALHNVTYNVVLLDKKYKRHVAVCTFDEFQRIKDLLDDTTSLEAFLKRLKKTIKKPE